MAPDYTSSPPWYETLRTACAEPGERPLDWAGVPARLLRGPFGARILAPYTNLYTCHLWLPDPEALAEGARGARPDALRCEALDPGPARALADQLAARGWWVETWEQFGNWYWPRDPAAGGGDEAAWWEGRPGRLRTTVVRKGRALTRAGGAITVLSRPEDTTDAIAAYESVYARSWKTPEPYPSFAATLLRLGFAAGAVRLGVVRLAGVPIAVELWCVWNGRATIAKLAYEEAHASLSAGTVLTRHMIGLAFADPTVRELDFGRGDDDYKRDWLPLRRPRFGLAAYDPRRPLGFVLAARNLGPKRARGRALRAV